MLGKAFARRLTVLAAGAFLVTAATSGPAVAGSGSAQARPGSPIAPGWTIQSTPSLPSAAQPPEGPGGTAEGAFSGVSCASADACTAVGQESPGNIAGGELAEVWDGASWLVIETDTLDFDFGSQLASVSCAAPGACLAVGSAQPSAELIPLAQTLSTAGAQDASPPAESDLEQLVSVSCVSTSSCIAVGNTGFGGAPLVIDQFNAGGWSALTPAVPTDDQPSTLTGVSCTSPSFCMAVGQDADGNTLAESWYGTGWSLVAVPNPAGATSGALRAVSCPATGECVGVGSWSDDSGSHPLVAQFRHGAWELISAPPADTGGTAPTLTAISCPARQVCTVVGSTSDPAGPSHPYAARLHRGRWHLQSVPDVPGAIDDSLASVSCPARRVCTAVGRSLGGDAPLAPLVERWIGAAHRRQHRQHRRARLGRPDHGRPDHGHRYHGHRYHGRREYSR
jgi:hypothetical protein